MRQIAALAAHPLIQKAIGAYNRHIWHILSEDGKYPMFTGIIEAIGEITHAIPVEGGVSLCIAAGPLDLSDVKKGDSIAVNGTCLTVTSVSGRSIHVDVSRETLLCTQGLDQPGGRVNLEKAMRFDDRLGGHLVSGHVDGLGEVITLEPVGGSCLLAIRAPATLAKYIARKGSITLNGVSLTVNRIAGKEFEVNLIPHTLEKTTLRELKPGSKVNLEVDMLARYAERLIATEG
jgi:riboflavin synthase